MMPVPRMLRQRVSGLAGDTYAALRALWLLARSRTGPRRGRRILDAYLYALPLVEVAHRAARLHAGRAVEADEAELVDPRPHPGGGDGEVRGMRERGGVGRFGDLDLRTAAVDRALSVRARERRNQPMRGQPANAFSEEGGVPVARGDELRGCNG